MLLVDKRLSFDTSFKGDFNLKNNIVSKDIENNFIFTGLQLMDRNYIDFIDKFQNCLIQTLKGQQEVWKCQGLILLIENVLI